MLVGAPAAAIGTFFPIASTCDLVGSVSTDDDRAKPHPE